MMRVFGLQNVMECTPADQEMHPYIRASVHPCIVLRRDTLRALYVLSAVLRSDASSSRELQDNHLVAPARVAPVNNLGIAKTTTHSTTHHSLSVEHNHKANATSCRHFSSSSTQYRRRLSNQIRLRIESILCAVKTQARNGTDRVSDIDGLRLWRLFKYEKDTSIDASLGWKKGDKIHQDGGIGGWWCREAQSRTLLGIAMWSIRDWCHRGSCSKWASACVLNFG